jgi:hypothetical protein
VNEWWKIRLLETANSMNTSCWLAHLYRVFITSQPTQYINQSYQMKPTTSLCKGRFVLSFT